MVSPHSAACLAIAGWASLLLGVEAAAVAIEVPLGAASVVIELHNADVDVLLDPTAQPILRARLTDDEPPPPHLDHRTADGVLRVRRPAEAAGADARMLVEVVIGAEQDVHLDGSDLHVVARETARPGVTAPRGVRYTLESSELELEGGRDTVVEASRTPVRLAGTRGLLTLTLEGATTEIRGHEGDVRLESSGAELILIDVRGRLEPHMTGGSLDVRGGGGHLEATADDAVVWLDGWRGSVTVTGSSTTVEGRGSENPGPWKLAGTDLEVSLDEVASPLTAELDGGRFRAAVLEGDVTLRLTGGCQARVELPTPCRVQVSGAAGGPASDRVDVVGCELLPQGHPAGATPELRGSLTVSFDGEGELEVEGRQ